MTGEKSEKKHLYSNWSRIDYPTEKPNEITETKVYDDGSMTSHTTFEHKGQSRAGGYSGENISNTVSARNPSEESKKSSSNPPKITSSPDSPYN
jgi:hypothetical protein